MDVALSMTLSMVLIVPLRPLTLGCLAGKAGAAVRAGPNTGVRETGVPTLVFSHYETLEP